MSAKLGKYQIRITSQNGHDSINTDSIDEAVQNIIDEYFNNSRWAYVGSTNFQFTAQSKDDVNLLNDVQRLKELLDSSDSDEVVITITGNLVGGILESELESLKQAVLDALNESNQIAIDKIFEAAASINNVDSNPDKQIEVSSETLNNPVELVKFAQSILALLPTDGSNGATILIKKN